MAVRNNHGGRRAHVLIGRDSRCVILDEKHRVMRRVTAYEATCLRMMPAKSARTDFRGNPINREASIGMELMQLIKGDVCYAFYAKPTHSVKIGRSANLIQRWMSLEATAGMLLQLLVVWKCENSKELESTLFRRYRESRTLGEWFTAEGVLSDLQSRVAESRDTPRGRRPPAQRRG